MDKINIKLNLTVEKDMPREMIDMLFMQMFNKRITDDEMVRLQSVIDNIDKSEYQIEQLNDAIGTMSIGAFISFMKNEDDKNRECIGIVS